MELEKIVEKEVVDLTDEEKAFMLEHKDELSDDHKEKFAEILEDGDE